MEYVVKEQIIKYFTEHNLFHPNHQGGLAHHSTATAVIQLHDLWLDAANNQELSATCLIDQKSAYDLIPHLILRDKLKIYNFHKNSISWLMSYLENRTQTVQIETKCSKYLPCGPLGAPQGSVLANIIHLIYSNDYPAYHDDNDNAPSVVFVDDDNDTVH